MQITIHYKIAICPNYTGLLFNLGQSRRLPPCIGMHALGLEFGSAAQGRVVCGTVYGEMHLKDLLGSFVRVGYRIPVPDFYLVLHGLRCRKSTIMD